MTRTTVDDELLARLLDELIAHHKSGNKGSPDEYCQQHPELADRLRELLPMMLIMEQYKPRSDLASASARFSEAPPQIGDYQVIREISRGGMGIVYEAMQLSLGRHVALKVMSEHLVKHPSAIERFRREARSAARLHHSNIVPVFEVGQDGETCFYAMQFIQGQALDEVIAELRRMSRVASANEPLDVRESNSSAQSLVDSLLNRDGFGGESVAFSNSGDSNGGKSSWQVESAPAPDNRIGFATSDAIQDRNLLIKKIARNSEIDPEVQENNSPASTSWGDGAQYYRNVAGIARQIADALQYAHGKHVIHRDIKPSNILLDAFGTAWITDFGLAKYEEATDQQFRNNPLTLSGDIVGTLRYMAPERLKGSHDPRTDVYGLGITLYELATLQPAFSLTPRAELLEHVTRQQPIQPRRVDPRVPRDLETIVLKAIEKEPARRYDSAASMSEDLRRFLANEPIHARRVGPIGRLRLWFRRNRWAATATVLSVVCLLILTFGSLAASLVYRTQRDRANQLRSELELSSVELKAKSWESHLAAARGLRLSRAHGQRFAALREIRTACELPVPSGHSIDELRTEAIGALCLPDFEVAHQWNYPIDSKIVGFDRSLSRYALSDSSGAVSVLRVADQGVEFQIPSIGEMSEYGSVVFANDDVSIAQHTGMRLRVYRVVDRAAILILDCDDAMAYDFDSSGTRIAIVRASHSVDIHNTRTGKLEQQHHLTGILDGFWTRWNPQKNTLAIGSQLLDLDIGEVQSIEIPFGQIAKTEWDPIGRVLAITNDSDAIFFWDIDRQQRWSLGQTASIRGTVSKFNSTGNRLLCTNWDHTWNLFDVCSGDQLMSMRAGQAWLGFSPDDRLAGADAWDGECRLYRFSNGVELKQIHANKTKSEPSASRIFGRPLLSMDNQWLLLGYANGDSRLVGLAPGLPTFPVELPGRPIGFEKDGSLLTIGELGLLRWPRALIEGDTTKFGPPKHLADLQFADNPSLDAAHQLLVVPRQDASTLIGRVTENGFEEVRGLVGQRDVRSTTFSPDGSLIVTSSHGGGAGSGCKVWNSNDGKLVAELPVSFAGITQFSPDGAWLLTSGIKPQLWRTNDWSEGPVLNAIAQSKAGCFSQDSNFLVLEDERDYVRLLRTNDGQKIATFALPASPSTRLWPIKFTNSGRLILVGADNAIVYELDLKMIREELAELGMDWDQPPFTTVAVSDLSAGNLAIDMGDSGAKWKANRMVVKASELSESRKFKEAIALLRKILESEPDHVSANNLLAWLLVTGPPKMRNPDESLECAKNAIKFGPEDPFYLNTLATACYRAGQWNESITALEKSTALGHRPEECNLYLFAMCFAQRGQIEKSREYFQQAESKWNANASTFPSYIRRELQDFREEARQLLVELESNPENPPIPNK